MTQDEIIEMARQTRLELSLIYGKTLQAATITVLIKDSDDAMRFLTTTFPQQPKESKHDTR